MDVASHVTPPGGCLEVVISFDTTGSMCSWLDELRDRIQDLIQRLQADIPGIRIAVFAHGDYCDKSIYVTKWIEFTTNVVQLCDFVRNVEGTGGGDCPECYELVLRQVRTELSWSAGSRRVLIMIGDDVPHEPREACNTDNIDWRAEVNALFQTGVAIYGVQCHNNRYATPFYQQISMATGGKHLQLDEFDSLFHTLMAVCYREVNDLTMLTNYEKEVRAKCTLGRIAPDIDNIFNKFRTESTDISAPTPLKTFLHPNSFFAATKATSALISTSVGVNLTGKKATKCETTLKIKPSYDKFKQSNLPRLKRENVPENNFSLRSLRWCPWTLAVDCGGDRCNGNTEMWERRRGRSGYRLKMLPLPKSFAAGVRGKPALFEVAVQGKHSSKKRYVVFSAFSSRSLGTRNWEQRLLGVARSQVDLVLNSGGRVYVRFCLVETKPKLVTSQRNIRMYDYAWRKVRKLRACPRDVVKGDVVISKSGL